MWQHVLTSVSPAGEPCHVPGNLRDTCCYSSMSMSSMPGFSYFFLFLTTKKIIFIWDFHYSRVNWDQPWTSIFQTEYLFVTDTKRSLMTSKSTQRPNSFGFPDDHYYQIYFSVSKSSSLFDEKYTVISTYPFMWTFILLHSDNVSLSKQGNRLKLLLDRANHC